MLSELLSLRWKTFGKVFAEWANVSAYLMSWFYGWCHFVYSSMIVLHLLFSQKIIIIPYLFENDNLQSLLWSKLLQLSILLFRNWTLILMNRFWKAFILNYSVLDYIIKLSNYKANISKKCCSSLFRPWRRRKSRYTLDAWNLKSFFNSFSICL